MSSPQRSQSQQPQPASSPVTLRIRADSSSFQTTAFPAYAPTSTSTARDHLPFRFGAEFELIIRPKHGLVPDFDASIRERRSFQSILLKQLADLLSEAGMPADVYDPNEDAKPDYSKWNVMLDGSLSKKHMCDGFYPVEIVTPIIQANLGWAPLIDALWSVLNKKFDFRRDTTCGFHIHVFSSTKSYCLEQIRQIAKAIVFWEPATAECAPPSRQDQVLSFCQSNINSSVPVALPLDTHSTWRGHQAAFDYIDNAARNDIIDFICPDKYRAWNFLPAKQGGHGSIEFRRPPGVVTAKQAKHWIAFTMAFIEMAMQFSPNTFASYVRSNPVLHDLSFADFESKLLACAKQIGVYAQLDPRLCQVDNPRTLHITMMTNDTLQWLQQHDTDYRYSVCN